MVMALVTTPIPTTTATVIPMLTKSRQAVILWMRILCRPITTVTSSLTRLIRTMITMVCPIPWMPSRLIRRSPWIPTVTALVTTPIPTTMATATAMRMKSPRAVIRWIRPLCRSTAMATVFRMRPIRMTTTTVSMTKTTPSRPILQSLKIRMATALVTTRITTTMVTVIPTTMRTPPVPIRRIRPVFRPITTATVSLTRLIRMTTMTA